MDARCSDEIDIWQRRFLSEVFEGAACFLLTSYSKMLEERSNLKMEFLIKREAELKDLENSQPIHTGKMRKPIQERTGRVWHI